MNPLEAFLRSQLVPSLPGPLNDLPTPVKAGLGVVAPVTRLPGAIGGLLGADQGAARALTGAGLVGMALANRAHLVSTTRGNQAQLAALLAAYQGGQGNPLARAQAVNEDYASQHHIASGLLNAMTDPLNLLGPAGKLAEAAKLGKLAEVLDAANRAQNLPGEALGKVAAPAVGKLMAGLADRQAAREALAKVVGNVPEGEIGRVGGKRQFGPIPPPEQFGYARGNPKGKIGPALPPVQDVPLPPETGPAFPERGNLPKDQLLPGVGRNGGKGIGPLVPPAQDVPLPALQGPGVPPPPPAVQPLADLLNAGRTTARPNPLEQLLGAGRATAAREVAPRQTLAQIEAAIPKLPETPEVGQLPLPETGAASTPVTPEPPALDFTDRAGVVKAVANAPLDHLNNVLRDLHNAVYPGQSADFAIPALTGQPKRAFRTSYLTDNPSGNAAEPYLDYLLSRVQKDPKAAARLAASNPLLADDINLLAESDLPLAEHKRLVQSLFGAGPFAGTETPPPDLPALSGQPGAQAGTLDDLRALITGGDGGKMGGYAPSNPAFYAKRLGIAPADVPGMLDQLVQEGTLGRLPDGSLGIKPAAPAGMTPAERADWQARYVGQSQAGTDILAAGDKVGDSDLTQADLNALSPQERMAALRKLAGGFADAAGGGGFGLLPARLGSTLAGAGVGTVVGGAAGGGLGLASGHDGDQLKQDVAAGAGLGALAGGSVGSVAPEIGQAAQAAGRQVAQYAPQASRRLEHTLLLDPEIRADVITAIQRARDNAAGNTGVKGPKEAWDAFWAYWRRQTVDTPKQLPQDATYRATVMEGIARKEFGLDNTFVAEHFQRPVSRERATGAYDLRNPLNQVLIQTGHPELIGQKDELVGSEFTDAVTATSGKQFTRLGNAVAGGIVGLGSGVKTVNPLAPLYGVARGAADLEYSAGMRQLISTANDAFREAIGWAGATRNLARDADGFLGDLASRGVNVAPLQAKQGLFSGDEVAALAGQQAGKDWATISEAAIRKAGDRAAFLAGDFRKSSETTAERWISKAVPFARWQIRSAPVLAEVAARHPVATIYALRELSREKDAALAQGKQAYQSGVTISDKTPLVGLAARARNGGAAGTLTVDPLGALVPYGNAMGGGSDLPADATGYQRLIDMTGRVGFQPNPAIQAAMYVAGQGSAPSSLSRTAGLEGLADVGPVLIRAGLRAGGNPNAADLVPDMTLPGGRTILDAARNVVEPAVAATGLPTTGGGPSDPAERRYAELVMERTKMPLSDPSNRGLLETMGSPDNALWQLAVLQSRTAAAVGNATSLTSPAQVTAQTAQSRQAQAAGKLPYSDYEISQAPKALQPAMRQANAAATAANPASATYVNISGKSREDLLVSRWKVEHQFMQKTAPALYQQRLKDYQASLR